jgi:hypothetical protein
VVEDIHEHGGTLLGSSRGPQGVGDMVDTLVRRQEGRVERDPSGNLRLKDIGVFLRDRITQHFAEHGTEVTIKYIDRVISSAACQPARSTPSTACFWGNTPYTPASTRDRFALHWTIVAPQHDISLSLTPTFDGQEVTMLGLSYWLARCEVVGNVAGRSGGGVGYIYIRRARGAPFEE